MRARPRRVLEPNPVEVVVVLDSDGSRLLARGCINPPPSTAMGIMNSRGLFLMGIVDPLVGSGGIWLWDAVVSESFDSLVD